MDLHGENKDIVLVKQHTKFDVITEIMPKKCWAMILVLPPYYSLTWT